MPVRTGLTRQREVEILAEMPENARTPAIINRELDLALQSDRTRSARGTVPTEQIIRLYTRDHKTLREIALLVGLSAPAVQARLRRAGISASQGEWIERTCGFCHRIVKITRGKARTTHTSYCTPQCAGAARRMPKSREWRQGSRLARLIVAQHYPLRQEHIVHHKDGDQTNNDRSNLLVFASHSDHLAYHHRKRKTLPAPLWDGAKQKK